MLYVKNVLGADALVIGSFTSLWCAVFVVFILLGGWVADRYDRKKTYLLGSALALPTPLIYALSPSWHMIFLAYFFDALSSAFVVPAYQSILFSSVERNRRSRAIAVINTLSHLVNMIVPPLSALAVQLTGGLNNLRLMFLLQFTVTLCVWLYTSKAIQIKSVNEKLQPNGLSSTMKDFFGQIKKVYRVARERKAMPWLYLYLTGPLAWGVVNPFWTIYAAEVCKSPLYVIGLLSTVSSLTIVLLQIPLSKVSDRKGRKKIILTFRPFRYLCLIILILAGSFDMPLFVSFIPLLAWVLDAIGVSSSPSWMAASREVIPEDLQGTWNSLLNLLYHSTAVFCGVLGGLLWNIDPRLPFIMALVVDSSIRYPLLHKIPETLLAIRYRPRAIGPHIAIYGLPGAGQTYTARLLGRMTGSEIVDERFWSGDEEKAERLIDKVLKRDENVIIEGKPAVLAARRPERSIVVLLVAPKEERIIRKMKDVKKPDFIVLNLIEEEDREVQKLVKRLYRADISRLPPFDLAINTERIPPETVAKIISLIHKEKLKR